MIDAAVRVLRAHGVIAYPTDTLYGLGVDPRSPEAVRKLFAVKAREAGHAVPLIAGDLGQAESVAVLTASARRLAAIFWPGPLSLVLAAHPGLAPEVLAADGSVAIRVPASRLARELAHAFGCPITSTSANLSGQPPTHDPAHVARALAGRLDYLLDGGPAPGGPPSTIVDARGEVPRLVRAGAVPWERVLESLE